MFLNLCCEERKSGSTLGFGVGLVLIQDIVMAGEFLIKTWLRIEMEIPIYIYIYIYIFFNKEIPII